MDEHDLALIRAEYIRGGLAETDLADDPVTMFRRWLADYIAAGLHEPNAMVLSTASADGAPSSRTVLLKGLDERGFVFYTNYESRKARELDAEPACSLLFLWHAVDRQVRVEGTASKLSAAENAAYFAGRPRDSQIGAWASPQSSVVASREELDRRYAEAAARFQGLDVPLPPFWGGYRVAPSVVELWQGRSGRMHDRLRYRLSRGDEHWRVDRLAP